MSQVGVDGEDFYPFNPATTQRVEKFSPVNRIKQGEFVQGGQGRVGF
jgi:hypothetical protein